MSRRPRAAWLAPRPDGGHSGQAGVAEEAILDLRMQGMVAVVTGASKGIGLAVVKALVAEGVHVIAGCGRAGGSQELPRQPMAR
jgi:methylmalonyl-CoA mutase cobalamin-binding subunit